MSILDRLNQPNTQTISIPDEGLIERLKEILIVNNNPIVAEIGIGIGATSWEIAKALDNRGSLQLYDFEHRCAAVADALAEKGFHNVSCHGNTQRHWDSYNWSLMKLLRSIEAPIYDLIYLDGSHIFLHDGLAFILCDKLLKPGGFIHFDDYFWRVADSAWMADTRDQFMTPEQIECAQVELVVRLLVDTNPHYDCVTPYKAYQKRKPL